MIAALRTVERLEGKSRSEWPAGPWDAEPDLIEWRDEDTGYPCLVVRGPMGALCGYVGVPPDHPWHGQDYGIPDVEAPGGLTYADACAGNICHVPLPGEPDGVWWFGFDCAHSWDIVPGMIKYLGMGGGLGESYKDIGYVQRACASLADQLKAGPAPVSEPLTPDDLADAKADYQMDQDRDDRDTGDR